MVQAELKARGIQLMVGRQFWAFLSGDERCMDELLDLARAAAEEAPPGEETSFSDRVDEKVVELVTAFKERYGDNLTADAWSRFLADHS